MKNLLAFGLLLMSLNSIACDPDMVDKVAIAEVKNMIKEIGGKSFGLGPALLESDRILINFVIYEVPSYGPKPEDVVGTIHLNKKCVLRDGALGPIRMIPMDKN